MPPPPRGTHHPCASALGAPATGICDLCLRAFSGHGNALGLHRAGHSTRELTPAPCPLPLAPCFSGPRTTTGGSWYTAPRTPHPRVGKPRSMFCTAPRIAQQDGTSVAHHDHLSVSHLALAFFHFLLHFPILPPVLPELTSQIHYLHFDPYHSLLWEPNRRHLCISPPVLRTWSGKQQVFSKCLLNRRLSLPSSDLHSPFAKFQSSYLT